SGSGSDRRYPTASTQNKDRASPVPATGIGHAGRIPIARSKAHRCRSLSAMPVCLSGVAVFSWTASLDEFFAKRVPDMLEQFRIARGLSHLHRIARPCNVHLKHILNLAGTRREQDDAISQR